MGFRNTAITKNISIVQATSRQLQTALVQSAHNLLGIELKFRKARLQLGGNIQFVPGLPKTRPGKIMQRILRKIAEGDTSSMGDTTTLLDPEVVEVIKRGRV